MSQSNKTNICEICGVASQGRICHTCYLRQMKNKTFRRGDETNPPMKEHRYDYGTCEYILCRFTGCDEKIPAGHPYDYCVEHTEKMAAAKKKMAHVYLGG